jgi:murein DD-endopeptidase MepM/ murein hydrolase activator NlpD
LWATPIAASEPLQTGQHQSAGDVIYTVQSGDTLIAIALRYNLTLAEIILVNDLLTPHFIFPGQQLILPGATLPEPLALPTPAASRIHLVQPGETMLNIAGRYNISVGELIQLNGLANPDALYIGQALQIPDSPQPIPGLPGDPFAMVELSEPTIIQGRVLLVKVTLTETAGLSGDFVEQPFFFYERSPHQFWGLVAIHALLEPNTYPLNLRAMLPDGRQMSRVEYVNVVEGPYGAENIWLDNNRTQLLDPDLIALEREKLMNLWSQISPRPRWEGPFWYPVTADTLRITSYFGTRRYYNDSAELSFHGGTDFGGDVGLPVYAPAAGRVVLAERLTVRGNAILIDHGLGLYSGYWHQNQVAVAVGQEVRPGDLIGYIGETGLVTGPHLHWEMRLNGIAVNPLQWVRESIP